MISTQSLSGGKGGCGCGKIADGGKGGCCGGGSCSCK